MGGEGEVFALIVEDDEELARDVRAILLVGHRVRARIATSVERARALVDEGLRPRLFLVDVKLPDGDGMSLAEYLRLRFPDAVIAILSGYHGRELLRRALRIDAAYVIKPYGPEQLATLVERSSRLGGLGGRLHGALDSVTVERHLSVRERQLMTLKLRFFSHEQIATRWDVAETTVNSAAASLLAKAEARRFPSLGNVIWRRALGEERSFDDADETRRDETRRDETRREQVTRQDGGGDAPPQGGHQCGWVPLEEATDQR